MTHGTTERNQHATGQLPEADPIGSTILGYAVARRDITGRAELVTSCDLTRDEADREADGLTAENYTTTSDVFVPVQVVEPDSRLTPVTCEGMPIGCWDVKNVNGGANFWFGTREQAEAHANRWGDGRAMGYRVGVWVDVEEYDAWQRSKTTPVPAPRDGGWAGLPTVLGVTGLTVGLALPLVFTHNPVVPVVPQSLAFLVIVVLLVAAIAALVWHPRVSPQRSPYPGRRPGVTCIPRQRNGEESVR